MATSEAKVLALVRELPREHSIIRSLTEYARTITDCPSIFMMHAGIQALMAAVPMGLDVQLGVRINPNTFTLLIGESASSRKTTAISWCTRIIRKAEAPEYLLIDASSPEGLIRELGENPRRGIMITEGGDWLNRTKPKEYQNKMRDHFVRIYDGEEVGHNVKDRKKSLKRVENHLVSVFMGCTPRHLAAYTEPVDFEGGLMNRFMIVNGVRERLIKKPVADEAGESWIGGTLKARIALYKGGAGTMRGMTVGAEDVWAAWSDALGKRADALPSGMGVLVARASTHALKLAQVLAIDTMSAAPKEAGDWLLNDLCVDLATQIVDWSIHDMLEVYAKIPHNRYEQLRESVLTVMRHCDGQGDQAVGYATIASTIKPSQLQKDLAAVLNSMVTEGSLYVWKASYEGGLDRFSLYPPPSSQTTDDV